MVAVVVMAAVAEIEPSILRTAIVETPIGYDGRFLCGATIPLQVYTGISVEQPAHIALANRFY
jgi:hypothetical protein